MSKSLIDKLNKAANEINKLQKAASNYVVVNSHIAEKLKVLFDKRKLRKQKIKDIWMI